MATETPIAGWQDPRPLRTGHASPPPDRPGARRVVCAVDRIVWLRLDLSDPGAAATVAAIRRRRPIELTVSVATALALRDMGYPTIVRNGELTG